MKTDCDLSAYISGLPQLDAVTLAEPDSAALAPFYEKYGFKGLVRTLGAAAPKPRRPSQARLPRSTVPRAACSMPMTRRRPRSPTAQQRDVLYTTILSEAQLDEWLAKIRPPS
jgi:DNA polymerase-1